MCDGYVPHPMDSAHNSLSHKSSLSYPVNDIAPKMKLTSLPIVLTLLPSAAATDSSYMITKSFNFKDDYYLKICPLSNAIAPNNVDLLMAALEEYGASHFKAEWENQLKSDLHNGTCTIDAMSTPEFSVCDWRYPDMYDVGELPTPGQSYIAEDCFVQRIYYKFNEMVISCPEDFSYEDLNKYAYTEAAFSGNQFTATLLGQCDEECLFSTTESTDIVSSDSDNAEMFVTRYVDLPVYLKCLDLEGYGKSTADMLIKALDEYFELYIESALTAEILAQVPDAHVFNYASPYKSERKYCSHGPYYADGNLINQVKDVDGLLVTKFTYGFDVIWFKPQDCSQELLPDITTIINEVFVDEDFLLFLKSKYPDLDFAQNSALCNIVDPKSIQVTLEPTYAPTPYPTNLLENGQGCSSSAQCVSGYCHEENGLCACNIDTNSGCASGEMCRFSCAYTAKEPRCYLDEYARDCIFQWGEQYTCADGNGDGIVDVLDKNSGCNLFNEDTSDPTLSPLPQIETISPTNHPVSSAPTHFPTIDMRSIAPTNIMENVTVSIAPTVFENQTNAPSIPLQLDTLVPTPSPSLLLSTPQPSYGNTDAMSASKTSSPTVFQQAITEAPVATLEPTPGPTEDEVKCNQECIVYPKDTEPDDCPIATVGTCGGGNRGDGICPFEGYCCSQWGYCGTTAEYCEDVIDSTVPTPSVVDGAPVSPTISVDAGKCGNGYLGEGLCSETSDCCSEWGYCGSGENYCYTTRSTQADSTIVNATDVVESVGTCGGGGVGNGICSDGLCCSIYGFCGEGPEYCNGVNEITATDASVPTTDYNVTDDFIDDFMPNTTQVDPDFEVDMVQPLPDNLKPEYGFRCGFSEVDARSNCKPTCTHHTQCSDGEECWGVQLNYCNTFEEGTHPICTNLDMANSDSRCGYDETSARGHCGATCSSDLECGNGEFCFPTLLNLCECHEVELPDESKIVFAQAKALLTPYFVAQDPSTVTEGNPRSSSSFAAPMKVLAGLGLVVALSAGL